MKILNRNTITQDYDLDVTAGASRSVSYAYGPAEGERPAGVGNPYGRTETIGTATQDAAFRFTGHFYHAESELHLAMYRAYDPELGRWISRDPLENAELLPEGPDTSGQ